MIGGGGGLAEFLALSMLAFVFIGVVAVVAHRVASFLFWPKRGGND